MSAYGKMEQWCKAQWNLNKSYVLAGLAPASVILKKTIAYLQLIVAALLE